MPRFKTPTGVKFFALLWLFILAFPISREVIKAQLVLNSYSVGEISYSPSESFAARLSEQFPDSIPMALWLADEEYWRGPATRNQAIDKLKKLRKKYPKQLEIPALELIRLSDGADNQRKSDPNRMRRAAKLAAEIHQIEPTNAFWPLMESGFYFRANQTEEALRAIKKVSTCTNFNDFSQKIIEERIKFAGQHTSIIYEQKLAIWGSTLYPHLAQLRLTNKAATKQSILAKKRGSLQPSLDIMAAVLTGVKLMRRDGQIVIVPLIAQATARHSLVDFFGLNVKPDPSDLDERMALQKQLAQKWEQYVRQNHRPELANIADFMREPSITSHSNYGYDDGYVEITGLPAPWGRISFVAITILFWTLVLSLALGLIWTLHAVIFSGIKDDITPNRGQITGCVLFSFWTSCGLVATALYLGLLSLDTFLYSTERASYIIQLLMPFFIAGIWLLPVVLVTFIRKFRLIKTQRAVNDNKEVTRLSPEHNRRRKIAWLLFLLLCGTTNWSWNANVTVAIPALATVIALPCLIVGLRLEWRHQKSRIHIKRGIRIEKVHVPTSVVPLAIRLGRLGLWAVSLICTVLTAIQFHWNLTWVEICFPVSIGFCAAAGALWLERVAPRDSFAFARKLAFQSAGTLAIVWSLFFIVASFGLWPLRAKLNHQLERRLQMGEIEWMKEMNKQSTSRI